MNHLTKSLAAFGILATLGACASTPEPQVIYAQPTFDKYGNAECEDTRGPNGAAGTASQSGLPPCIPEDDCVNGYTAGANSVPCVPVPARNGQGTPRPGTVPNQNPGQPII